MVVPQISLPIILGGALVDSINPCVFGVLILLLTTLIRAKKRSSIIKIGLVYILGVYVTYLLGGITLLMIFRSVREITFVSQILYAVIGSLVIFFGFTEVKDFFWYGKGFSLGILPRFTKIIERSVKSSHTSLISAFGFGVLVTLIELPCTGGPYLAILALMAYIPMQESLPLLLIYNLVFVLPLFIIIYLSYTGVGSKRLEGWRRDHRGLMRLGIGLFLLALGVWIITTIADWLLFPLIIFITIVLAVMAIIWKLKLIEHHH